MKYRKLRIAWSGTWGVMAALLMILWVRSYWRSDICGLEFAAEKRWNICSVEGRFFLIIPDYKSAIWAIGKSRKWDIRSEYLPYVPHQEDPYLRINYVGGFYSVIVPHLVFVAAAVPLAAAPWLRFRFSLRTLLIATTLIAILLGLIVWTMRI